jgi:hypothetical protein
MKKFIDFITEADMTIDDLKVGRYYKAKSSKKNIGWEIWAIDDNSVALMRDSDSRGKRVPIDKFLKNWVRK